MNTSKIYAYPEWLKKRLSYSPRFGLIKNTVRELSLETVCDSARCPNRSECFSRNHLTFLVMGGRCTRSCTFCSVKKGGAEPLDEGEPARIREAVKRLGLEYVVVTSVTRDDLDDGGAKHLKKVAEEIKCYRGDMTVELLVPDMKGDRAALKTIAESTADIIGHNIETVPRLYRRVRPQADYKRSLGVLRAVKEIDRHIYTKSGIMVGLGERQDEVVGVIADLASVGCDILTIGQYLRPDTSLSEVDRFVAPEEFEDYRIKAVRMGFRDVLSGPFVRSSIRPASGGTHQRR